MGDSKRVFKHRRRVACFWCGKKRGDQASPIMVERKEDDDDAYFTHIAKHAPFRLGHKMKALTLSSEDDLYGVMIKVRENRRIGSVPLCDVEVTPKSDRNFWFVREYVVWFANR